MTNTKYAFGFHERGADENLWLTFSAEDNTTAYTAVANSLYYHHGDDFNIAGILLDIKYADGLSNLSVTPERPAADHTLHIYDATEVTVTLYNDDGDTLVTFPVLSWIGKYLDNGNFNVV